MDSFVQHLIYSLGLLGWFLGGILAWCLTGIDDALIFNEVFKRSKNKTQCIMGLITAIISMIFIVVLLKTLAIGIPKILNAIQLLAACFVWNLAKKCINDDCSQESHLSTKSSFSLAFQGYILNSTDDITVNLALVLNASVQKTVIFFVGVCLGVALMVLLVRWGNQRIRDYPLFRGIVLFAVSGFLFVDAIENIGLHESKIYSLTFFIIVTLAIVRRSKK